VTGYSRPRVDRFGTVKSIHAYYWASGAHCLESSLSRQCLPRSSPWNARTRDIQLSGVWSPRSSSQPSVDMCVEAACGLAPAFRRRRPRPPDRSRPSPGASPRPPSIRARAPGERR
jgi:hypothetical protein